MGDRGVTVTPLTVLTADGRRKRPTQRHADPTDGFRAELRGAVEGVRTGRVPDALSAQTAADALRLCHAEIQSVRTGRSVHLR